MSSLDYHISLWVLIVFWGVINHASLTVTWYNLQIQFSDERCDFQGCVSHICFKTEPNTDIHLVSTPGNWTSTPCEFSLAGHIASMWFIWWSWERKKDGDTELGEQEMVKFSRRIGQHVTLSSIFSNLKRIPTYLFIMCGLLLPVGNYLMMNNGPGHNYWCAIACDDFFG